MRLPLLLLTQILSLLAIACSSRSGPAASGSDGPRQEASCLPDHPACLRVLPGIGTYRATVAIEVKATSVPPVPAGGAPDEWTPAEMELSQQETVMLRRDAAGHVQGLRELADEDGFHFTYVDPKFCPGLRYEPAVCRDADEGEVEKRFAELAGTYREVHAWIGELARWESDGSGGWVLRPLAGEGEAAKNIRLVDLKGSFHSDPVTGEHRVRLEYHLSGSRPDGVGYSLRVRYEHTVSPSVEPIRLPEDALHHEGRLRPLMDRKALLGDPTPATLRHLYQSRSAD